MTTPAARFRIMLSGPILPMLAKLSGPNIATGFAFGAMSIADAGFVGRLGTVPLAAIALVFPVQTMMQMMSVDRSTNASERCWEACSAWCARSS